MFKGDFVDGIPHGSVRENLTNFKFILNGKITHDFTHFIGGYRNGKRELPGILTSSVGTVYDGNWKNGKMQGRGVFTDFRTDTRYEGTWVNGELHGDVKVVQEDGGERWVKVNKDMVVE